MNTSSNEESLTHLVWTISNSQGEFKLIFAHCKYASLHKKIGNQIKENCPVNIQEIELQPSVQKLYSTIREQVKDSPPEALMVFGLESVSNIDELLRSMNQIREEFKINFSFPLILWVNDQIVRKLIRLIPDFESWGITSRFPFAHDKVLLDLQEDLGKKANQIFSNFLLIDANDFLNQLTKNIENRSEIDLAIQDLFSRDKELESSPELEAKIKLMLGRDDYANKEFDSSLKYFQDSIELWEKSEDNLSWQLLLLFHIGICHCHNSVRNDFNEYIRKCFDLLSRHQKLDLSEKFVTQLGEVLQSLEAWERLRTLAQIALQKLPKTSKSQYQFILAISQTGLGDIKKAIETLEIARWEKDLSYNPRLYVKILEHLRSLYFKQGEYLAAFKIKQEKLSLEQQYGLKAFIGSGCLQPERKIIYSDFGDPILIESISHEVTTSTRNKDVERLIERIKRPDYKLTIIHGKPGVGKTSMLEAGLIPALNQEVIENRQVLTILQQDYECWIENLGKHLIEEVEKQQNVSLLATNLNSPKTILNQLRKNSEENLLTVLIFDELEYLFFYYREMEYEQFYDFLDQCLNIPYTEVIISLRDDYLYHLLEWNRLATSDVLNSNILDKQFLCDLGDFSLEDSKSIICSLNKKTNLSLELSLIDKVTQDLTDSTYKIIPFEFQIVLSQIEKKQIKTLDQYNQYGAKQSLIKDYLEEVIKDCGTENEEIAKLVLYFLTDKQNNRLRKNRTSLEELLEVATNKLETILYIFMKSWILIQSTEVQDKRYQLALAYLPSLINQHPSFKAAELRLTKQELRQSEQELRQSEVEHLSALAQAEFLLNDQLPALVKAVKAGKLLLENDVEFKIKNNIIYNLRQVIYEVKELNRLQGHDDGVLDITVCEKLQIIASASIDGTLRLWEFDGTPLKSLKGHNDWIYGIAFSLDGTMLASASDDKTIRLWRLNVTLGHSDLALRQIDVDLIKSFEDHSAGVRSVCFNPDGNILASSSEDGTIKLWQIDGTLVHTFEGHTGGVRSICFSPDGTMLASASDDKTIKLWRLDGTEIQTFQPLHDQAHQDWVCDVKFSPQGDILASGSADTTIKLWNLDGTLKKTFLGHRGSVKSISFSPQGDILASASADGDLKLWQLDGTEIETFHGHGGGVQGIGFSKDGTKVVSGSSDKTIRLWQIDGIALKTIKAHNDWVWGIAFSNDGKLFASVSADKTVKIWDIQGNQKHLCKGHNHLVRGIGFSPDSKMLATGSADGTVKIWDVNNGKEIKTFQGHESKVWSVRFSPNSEII
jgi:WD40 repeat protein